VLLGPLAVHPAHRNRGIGTTLVRRAIARARVAGHGVILLVGDAPYYGRFGFSAAPTGGLWMPGRYDRDRLLAESDFLSLHVPLTPNTHHLISAETLSRMKRTAFLINTTRGPVVDEAALAAALGSGVIAGAALDVFENEPKVHPALIPLKNVVLAPHMGSASIETRTKMAVMAAQNVVALFQGKLPPNVLNPDAVRI